MRKPKTPAAVKAQILEWKVERHSGKAVTPIDLDANVTATAKVIHEHRAAVAVAISEVAAGQIVQIANENDTLPPSDAKLLEPVVDSSTSVT